jgi:hypothetical protein
MSFTNRSDALIELLEELTQEGHEYVLVGGYAVSAFKQGSEADSPPHRGRGGSRHPLPTTNY